MKTLLTILSIMTLISCGHSGLKYPVAQKVDTTDVYFGTRVADPYRWLEDPNSPQTRDWIKAEDDLTFGYLGKIPFRDSIKKRLTKVWNYERFGIPVKKAGKYFYLKNTGLQNQDVLYEADSIKAEPKVILDPNLLSKDGTVSLSGFDITADGKYLAYSVATAGSDWNEIRVKNLIKGQDIPDTLKWIKFSGLSCFKNGFFYSRYPEPTADKRLTVKNQNHKIYYHVIGDPQAKDKLVYEDTEHPDRIFDAFVTDDEHFLIVSESESTYGNIIRIKDLTKINAPFVALNNDFNYDMSVIGNAGDKLYLLTNNDAPRYKLVELDFNKQTNNYLWKVLIPEQSDVLEQAVLGGDKIIAKYMKDAHALLKLYCLRGNFIYNLALPDYVDVPGISSKQGDNEVFYSVTSYTIPLSVYKYDIKQNKSEVIFKPKVDFNPDDYITKLDFYKSKDSTRIPVYIVYKKGLKLNGNNPLYLYGYGGFNISLLPRFSPARIVWLENGGIFANANIRGGGEYGEEWHRAGTKLHKQHVFDDFIAAAEYMIKQKYTNPKKIVIEGRSNGGLLIGAVVNQRPDLFAVALPGVGVMDMLRFSKFTIGWAWESDYGSVKDSAEFRNLYAISPLHNIKSGVDYPAIMVITADHDDRVVPAHSFKYIATMQEKYKGPHPILIRIQTSAGHGAGKPTSMQIEEQADLWAFTYYNMGINPYRK